MDSIEKPHWLPEALSAKFIGSFAYVTIKDRLPVILTKVIDGLARNKAKLVTKYGQESHEKLKEVINRLSRLKNEITTDKALSEIVDEREDVRLWNGHIEQEAAEQEAGLASWFTSPWLLVECYMYRRIQEAFELSGQLRHYDPFEEQKQLAFLNSLSAIKILAAHLIETKNNNAADDTTNKTNFSQFVQLALWGNKCDLSISGGADSSQTSNPLTQLDQLGAYILVNDIESMWNHLHKQKSLCDTLRVDIILDNAGFELFTDLCLADFLMSQGLASRIHFHLKEMPWFVSDVTATDFQWTLHTAKEEAELKQLVGQWEKYFNEGVWTVSGHHMWTVGHDYSLIRRLAPQLHSELSQSQLLIFKGDLNYRKLTGDLKWPHTTSFEESLRGFHPTALCSLRTLKADVVVGLRPGQAQSIEQHSENWMISGDYAVIQFHN